MKKLLFILTISCILTVIATLITNCRKDVAPYNSTSGTTLQNILASDSFSIGNTKYIPTEKKCDWVQGLWQMHASYTTGSNNINWLFLHIYLDTIKPNQVGIYSLNLASRGAVLLNHAQTGDYYTAISGQLNITVSNNGYVRAVFNNIGAKVNGNTSNIVKLSGDITVNCQ